MPRVATKLTPTKDGGFIARKRIPTDAQEAYELLHGVRWEERFRASPGTPITLARAKHREWLSEIETRIANIRAHRNGSGQTLTPMQARALAGEWYKWFTEQHLAKPRSTEHWEFYRERIGDEVRPTILQHGDPSEPEGDNPDIVWERSPEAREAVRPMLADWGETSRFLAARRVVLHNSSRDLFLDYLYVDFDAALKLLIRRARGDYTADEWPAQFPRFERDADPGLTPWVLFERWVSAVKPAPATVDRWRGVFLKLDEDFGAKGARTLTAEEAQQWADGLISSERSARTVKEVWIVAAHTVYAWALKRKSIPANPLAEVEVSVPRKIRMRESRAFRTEEVTTILTATLAVADTSRPAAAAKRWVPWLCAYTGARAGEITQLRGADVLKRDGVNAIKISPEAGTVKTKEARVVPLHDHLIEQGFLDFVKANGKGPLFYNEPKEAPKASNPTNPPKPRYVKARERIAEWVRRLGVDDPELQPNHGWRHTFKQIADRHNISERVSDTITGHAPANVARGYGTPTLQDMAAALRKFPRYEV